MFRGGVGRGRRHVLELERDDVHLLRERADGVEIVVGGDDSTSATWPAGESRSGESVRTR